MAVPIMKMRNYLMSRIDKDDVSAVEMVERYIDLLNVFRDAQQNVSKNGTQIVVENGTQSYIKSNPLINDMKNVNGQLMTLKKNIDKHISEYENSKPKHEVKKEGLL